jgi:mannosyltransferase OCH1-like enzyme
MIPKIIHQIWLGDQGIRPEPLMHTWKDMNPEWEHKFWTEENMPPLRNQAQFDAMEELAGKADILRYEILLNEGGFYIDADAKCISPLDDFFLENECFCCWENEETREGLMANGYLGAVPNNKLITTIVETISSMDPAAVAQLPELMAWQVTGPRLLTSVANTTNYSLTIYPSHYFIPNHYSGSQYKGEEKIYGEQYYMSTPPSGRSYEEFRS